MEPTLSSSISFTPSRVSGSQALPKRILSSLVHWQRRAVSRRQLALLDTRLLADAGISEAQRQVELSKPFWR
ncbi:DUF1127 domain-containing protein [Pseudomonas sp. 5P_3.1_Bac2]|uniref:DUF1127 domain-containing protein n=1 Tax=Pseudomonas sp. 5P_3.1_Bac2 TaxID=2971617 RepID=UPI0021CA797A|nr:DUF1127 domain-containing protein [Pseudomonas sp. 5P_3.1_Bac2]MCU1719247.1 DUF1127 domain-containing protein [Pseudomonas sp. 5P_3.1_Bac2]